MNKYSIPVYPRWRGEHVNRCIFAIEVSGLSPLARGTPRYAQLLSQRLRFIPAGAGNTHIHQCVRPFAAVYPRWRGEHVCVTAVRRSIVRFIPAGAGNTVQPLLFHLAQSVYPRWRGEHGLPNGVIEYFAGLSPLARGTPLMYRKGYFAKRFIPAGAGNTIGFNIEVPPVPVYPRWRGEHYTAASCCESTDGLSPLARGTRRFRSDWFPRVPVYPRWRGEHRTVLGFLGDFGGLSPLARGTLSRKIVTPK